MIERLEKNELAPVELPSSDDLARKALDLSARVKQDAARGRAELSRLLRGGKLEIGPGEGGRTYVLSGLRSEVIFPIFFDPENNKPSEQLEGRCTDLVAGAGLELLTTCNPSGSSPEPDSEVKLDEVDFAFLDYLVEKAIEAAIPSSKPICSLAMIRSLADQSPKPKRKRRRPVQ